MLSSSKNKIDLHSSKFTNENKTAYLRTNSDLEDIRRQMPQSTSFYIFYAVEVVFSGREYTTALCEGLREIEYLPII